MPLKLNSSGGGSVTLDVPVTASAFNVVVPANAGTVVTTGSTAAVTQGMLASNVAGNGPAFSAYQSTGTSCAFNANTKVIFQLEEYDTANCFDPSTSRFTPNVAGYYIVSAYTYFNSTVAAQTMIYKNGSQTAGKIVNFPQNGNSIGGSALIYMNGTTDYLEVYVYVNTAITTVAVNAHTTYFQAALVRAA